MTIQVPNPYEANITAAESWASAHSATMTLLFESFDRLGEWPNVHQPQRALVAAGDGRDLIDEVRQMPGSLGGQAPDGAVFLTPRGLRSCGTASTLLQRFVELIRIGVHRYADETAAQSVGDGDLRAMGLDESAQRKLAAVVFSEHWPFDGGSGDVDGTWERHIGSDFRHLVAVRTIDDYLAVQARLRYGEPPAAGEDVSAAGPTDDAPAPSRIRPGALFSERLGAQRRELKPAALARLVFKLLVRFDGDHYFTEAFHEGGWRQYDRDGAPIPDPPLIADPEQWLILELGREDLWEDLREPVRLVQGDQLFGVEVWTDRDLLFDVLELYHRDVVSRPSIDEDGGFDGCYDRKAGQEDFRAALLPILGRCVPPFEMRANGQIIPFAAPGLELLSDPDADASGGAELDGKVNSAVRRFRARSATKEDQLAALNELAGVLERL